MSELTIFIPDDLHRDTAALVGGFATALAEKLRAAEKKYGYSNKWAEPDWMDECRAKLIEHVRKGDPRDVAAYCAFLWFHDQRTAVSGVVPSQAPSQHPDTILLDFIASEYLDVSAFAMPTGAGDADVGWKLVQEHEGKKGRVEVACHYRDDLRAAIREAMQKLGYTLPASGVPPLEGKSNG